MEPQLTRKSSKNPTLWVLLTIAILLVAGVGWNLTSGQGKGDGDSVANMNENENTNVVANTNMGADTSVIANTNSTQTDISGWKTYTSLEAGLTFRYPTDWNVAKRAVSGGSFETEDAASALVIEPMKNTLDFPPAGRCVLQLFPASGQALSYWIQNTPLYQDRGLSILSQSARKFGDVIGIQVIEGGANYQTTSSFYFLLGMEKGVARFGHYLGGDTRPEEDLKTFVETCERIQSTLTGM